MTTRAQCQGIALSRLLFWSVLLLTVAGISLPFFSKPLLAIDSDNDGLENDFETAFGTDQYQADSDGDMLSDFDEIFIYGTDPNLTDTDGDSLLDNEDPEPLSAELYSGGTTTPDRTWTQNINKCPVPASTAQVGLGVNPVTGELTHTMAVIDLGMGYRERNQLVLTYLSGIHLNGPWGAGIISNWDYWVEEQGSGDVHVFTAAGRWIFTEDSGVYTPPAGVFFDLDHDSQNGLFVLTAMRGGKKWEFDDSTGLLGAIEDRFGNVTTINRNGSDEITSVDFPEGNSVTLSTWGTGRYSGLADWCGTPRTWMFSYNCCDELAKFIDPDGNTRQYFYINGSNENDLNGNLTRVKLPDGTDLMRVTYKEPDFVLTQEVCGSGLTLTRSGTYTDVTDFSGNNSRWTYSAGAVVPSSLIQYSNRDVRAGDPASWTTTFAYNGDFLRTKTVFPAGNRVDVDYNAAGCVTEIRKKATDTDTDNDTTDHVSTFTYGSTFYQLEDSTNPNGDTIERTLDSDELVTRIDYPDITHPVPDVSIYETMTWNSYGQLVTHTDAEGVVTRHDYVASGTGAGLLWKKTVDYGTGKLNLVTEFGYNDWRYLTSSEDPDGNETTFTTNELGQRTGSTSAGTLDYEVEYVIGTNGYVLNKRVENVDETGTRDTTTPWIVTTYNRDALGRATSIAEALLTGTRTTTIAYGGNGETLQVTLPEGNIVKQVFDERGMLASRCRGFDTADASTETWEYDDNGNMVVYTNGRGKEYQQSFNDYDQLTEVTTPLGHYVSFVVDKLGQQTEILRYNSGDTLLAHRKQYFDELGQVYQVEDWLDHPSPTADEWMTTSIDRDRRGLVELVTDPMNHETENTWDNARRLICQEDHLGNKTEYDFTYDSFVPTRIDQVEVVPGGGTQTFVIEQTTDALHRVTQRDVVDRTDGSNKHTSKWKYDFANFVKEVEDAEGHKTWYEQNGMGMVTRMDVDLGSSEAITTQWTYDDNLNLVLLTDDGGNETIYRYNYRDVLEETEYDDGEKRTLTLLDDDQVGGWTDENGTVVTTTIDDDGRLTARSINRAAGVLGPTSESYTWDGLNRLTEAKNNNSTVQRAYDTLSRLTSETQGPNPIGAYGKTISYTYEDDGDRATCQYFSGYSLTYTSDALGRWTKIEDASSNDLVTQSFYGAGFRSYQQNYLNGTQTTIGYDGFRQPTDIDHEDSGSTVFSGFDYAFDKVGNPLYAEFTHDGGKGNLYAYDQAYRLTSAAMGSNDPSAEAADDDWADYAYVKKIDFNMDDDSNRSSVVETPYGQSAATTSYSSNNLNQYTSIASVSQSHDDNGNLIDDGVRDLAYDYRNSLIKVVSSSVVLSECEFDALGRRTEQITGDGAYTTRYFYDGEHVVEEYDGSENLLRKFVYGQRIDEIRVMVAPDYADVDDDQNTTEVLNFYYHTDMLGNVTHVTDESEEVVESYEYTPYGQTTIRDGTGSTISSSAIWSPYMFTVRRLDENTGLYHTRQRAYDPERGRFLQRDPLGYGDGTCLLQFAGDGLAPLGKRTLGGPGGDVVGCARGSSIVLCEFIQTGSAGGAIWHNYMLPMPPSDPEAGRYKNKPKFPWPFPQIPESEIRGFTNDLAGLANALKRLLEELDPAQLARIRHLLGRLMKLMDQWNYIAVRDPKDWSREQGKLMRRIQRAQAALVRALREMGIDLRGSPVHVK